MNHKIDKYNVTLSCWKFIAALSLVGAHALVLGQTGDYAFHGAYVYTEFFFIVSGFYMIKFLEDQKFYGGGVMDYVKKTWRKIFPYTTVAITIYYILLGVWAGSIKEGLRIWLKWPTEILFINSRHIFTSQFGQLWYVSAMLFAIPIICWLFLKDRDLYKIVSYTAPLLWYGYSYTMWGHLGHRGVFIDLIRAFANLLLGGFVYYISRQISQKEWLLKYRWVSTITAWGCFGLTIYLTYSHYWSEYDIECIFLFIVALVLVQSKGFIDLKVKRLNVLSVLSMTVYIVHVPVGNTIQRFFGGTISQKYTLYYLLSIFSGIVLMILVRQINVGIFKYKAKINGSV